VQHSADSPEMIPLASVLAAFPEVSLAYLFGSRARGEAGPRSDYDFAVLLNWAPELLARRGEILSRLTHELVCLLGVGPGQLDLVILNRAPVELAYAVIAEGKIVFERDVASRVEYEAYVLGRYGDYLPILRAQRREILEGGSYEARAERYREALGRTRRAIGKARAVSRDDAG
jgi:predicted nucleotidyltransferase